MDTAAPMRVTAMAEAILARQAADEVAGEGIARGGGVHRVGLEGLLAHGVQPLCRHAVGDAARAAQGDQHRQAGVARVQHVPGPLGLVAAGALAGLHLVHQQPGQLAEVHRLQSVVVGGGVQHDAHAPGAGKIHDEGQVVDFVLQHQPVARPEVGEGFVDLRLRNLAVGAAVEQYAVLALAVHLYDGMALHAVDGAKVCGVHAIFVQQVAQECAVRADATRVANVRPGPGQRHRLVQPLAPGQYLPGVGLQRFPRAHKVFHRVHVIHVQRAKVQYSHRAVSFRRAVLSGASFYLCCVVLVKTGAAQNQNVFAFHTNPCYDIVHRTKLFSRIQILIYRAVSRSKEIRKDFLLH